MKTVQVVERLVEPFVGTHRTIYVDRFYTSLELMRTLADKNLYLTGTMLANRIPQAIWIAKTSSAGSSLGQKLEKHSRQVYFVEEIEIWFIACQMILTILNLMSAAAGVKGGLFGYPDPFQLQTTTNSWVVSIWPTCVDCTAIRQ